MFSKDSHGENNRRNIQGIAQVVECRTRNAEAVGAGPTTLTKIHCTRSSTDQSVGLRNRRLQVRVLPGVPMMRLYPPSLRTRRKVTGSHGGSNPLRRSINIPMVPGPDGKGSDCNSEALSNSSEFDSHRHLQTRQKDSNVAE